MITEYFLTLAQNAGLTLAKPVVFDLVCTGDNNALKQYKMWVSFYSITDITDSIWINANPTSPGFLNIYLIKPNRVATELNKFATDICDAIRNVVNNPSPGLDMGTVTAYVDSAISGLRAEMLAISGSTLPPVQNIVALRAVSVHDLPDKTTIFVEDSHVYFSWDTGSGLADNNVDIVIPDITYASTGRWVMVILPYVDGGQY